MSRSTYIWVVTRADLVPVAAFTVKYELADWLAREPEDRLALHITRLRDGYTRFDPVVLDPITLEPALPIVCSRCHGNPVAQEGAWCESCDDEIAAINQCAANLDPRKENP